MSCGAVRCVVARHGAVSHVWRRAALHGNSTQRIGCVRSL